MTVDVSYLVASMQAARMPLLVDTTAAVGNDKAGYTPGLWKKSATDATTEINFPSRRFVAKNAPAIRTREALLKS